jgi:hypothetical protein
MSSAISRAILLSEILTPQMSGFVTDVILFNHFAWPMFSILCQRQQRARTPQGHGPSFIANEIVFEPRGLNRELLWSEVPGSFPEGLAPPAGREAAAPAGPGGDERLGCEN